MTDTRVGIVGDAIQPIADVVESAGGTSLVDARTEHRDVDPAFVIAVGDRALRSLTPDSTAPILPVETHVPGLDSLSLDRARTELPRLLDLFARDRDRIGRHSEIDPQQFTVTHPVVGIDRPDGRVHALSDVTLVTAEPARISEYTVVAGNAPERRRIMSVRADGIVVATPIGSHGYAHDAGGPRLAAETDVGVVVPIAPFSIDADHWVVPLSDIRLTVDRDDAAVELRLDGHRAGNVSSTETLRLRPVTTIETIAVEQGLERL